MLRRKIRSKFLPPYIEARRVSCIFRGCKNTSRRFSCSKSIAQKRRKVSRSKGGNQNFFSKEAHMLRSADVKIFFDKARKKSGVFRLLNLFFNAIIVGERIDRGRFI